MRKFVELGEQDAKLVALLAAARHPMSTAEVIDAQVYAGVDGLAPLVHESDPVSIPGFRRLR